MILKNGKRIDGCTDTLPIGTVQPFLGLIPPAGYLVCNGQSVSKVTYPELYKICGSTFGQETETHFYLPDLRGKTIAGYDSNDNAMNTIGKLLGNKTHTHTSAAHTHTIAGHTHTTGNHTLTVAEMPSHMHEVMQRRDEPTYVSSYYNTNFTPGSAQYCLENDAKMVNTGSTDNLFTSYTGSSEAHNHGNTGSTSLTTDSATPGATGSNTNFQPTMTMNWIVKAVMLIPEYFIVENTLTSTSASNALSAAQGKLLNDTKFDKVGGIIDGNIEYKSPVIWDADYDDYVLSGNYYFGGGCFNSPDEEEYVRLYVNGDGGVDTSQLAVCIMTNDLYLRTTNNYSWSGWRLINFSNRGDIDNNFNYISKQGMYSFTGGDFANKPTNSGTVEVIVGGDKITQKVIGEHNVAIRTSHNAGFTWEDWHYYDDRSVKTYTYSNRAMKNSDITFYKCGRVVYFVCSGDIISLPYGANHYVSVDSELMPVNGLYMCAPYNTKEYYMLVIKDNAVSLQNWASPVTSGHNGGFMGCYLAQ